MTAVLSPYSPDRARELVTMWRASFERGVGLADPHPLEEQQEYLQRELVPNNRLVLALDGEGGPIVGFVAFSDDTIAALYVRVDQQRRGVGRMLLDLAKASSSGKLRLFTFARNDGARAFYERNGFRAIAYGFEPHWQLEDVEYEWVRTTIASA